MEKDFTTRKTGLSCSAEFMGIASTLPLLGLAALLVAGCAGPEKKLGRGLLNVTEVVRLGEFRRSLEQTSIWDGTDQTYTTGVIRGVNRTFVRTMLGAFEVGTFILPTPTYDAMLTSRSRVYPDRTVKNLTEPFGGMTFTEYPTYPDNFTPGLISDSMFHTDTSLGFSGGDVMPFIPGSRFKIFDN
jgi:putative exosortase-associated protein (TIGR04073 family)